LDQSNVFNTLVAGFGNSFRQDDGVARVVVNGLRKRLGRPPLDTLDDGFGDLGHPVDTVVLHQLVPELAEDLRHYDLVIFVDAHVGTSMPEPIHEERIAETYRSPFVYHQTHPSTVLALTRHMYDAAPAAYLVSLLGHDFDFGEGLSAATAQLVEPAIDRILARIAASIREGAAEVGAAGGHEELTDHA
jgi:hydrogenase maturation protease